MSETGADIALPATPLSETLFVWFQRGVAVYCLLFGVLYWIRLLGVYPGELWRFDLMPTPWQIAGVTLSAFFPFAAIGLWMLASWGPVVWFICAGAETIMYAGFPDIFGRHDLVIASHAAVVLIYLVFRIVLARQRRRAPPA